MPHVIDDTDALQQTATSSAYDKSPSLPLELPPSQRQGVFAMLRRLVPFLRRQPRLRQPQGTPGTQKFELPIDIMARQYPDIYIRTMSGSG